MNVAAVVTVVALLGANAVLAIIKSPNS
jgi:hypothetical protein